MVWLTLRLKSIKSHQPKKLLNIMVKLHPQHPLYVSFSNIPMLEKH